MNRVKSKRDNELFKMMNAFKALNEKEQGYVLGLAEGLNLCKPNVANSKQINMKGKLNGGYDVKGKSISTSKKCVEMKPK